MQTISFHSLKKLKKNVHTIIQKKFRYSRPLVKVIELFSILNTHQPHFPPTLTNPWLLSPPPWTHCSPAQAQWPRTTTLESNHNSATKGKQTSTK